MSYFVYEKLANITENKDREGTRYLYRAINQNRRGIIILPLLKYIHP